MTEDYARLLDHFNLDMTDELTWTESSWFSFAVPERDLGGLIWTHFRPNQNCLCGGPAVWDKSGELVWEFRYFDWQAMRPMPHGRYGVDYDKYDYTTDWSLTVKMLEPMRRYRITYDRAGFKLDLVFTAVSEPNIMNAGPVDIMKRAFRLHFEQPGRIEGWIELDGERIAVDCFGVRDGGHGPRNLETAAPGGYCWSTADEKTGFHILAPNALTHEAKAVGGYVLKDGTISHIVEGVRRVVERDGPRPIRVEVEARDALGRELHATGREHAHAKFMLFPERGQWWQLFKWDYEGFTDAVGEDQEYYGIHEFRKWHRGGPDLWKTR